MPLLGRLLPFCLTGNDINIFASDPASLAWFHVIPFILNF